MTTDAPHCEHEDQQDPLGPPAGKPRLAVFGGSFDPPHNGHLQLARQVIDRQLAQEVLFVPAGHPPHKNTALLSAAEHRLAMVGLALEPYPQFCVSDIEIVQPQRATYTIHTLETLKQAFPGYEIRFLMGMDSLVDFHTWYRASELANCFSIIVYPRPRVAPPSYAELVGKLGQRSANKLLQSVLTAPTLDVSATEIRRRVAQGKPIDEMVPAEVAAYISDHQLYRTTNQGK